ncbi:hypothetical protein GCM10022222_63830 [Amycolatopsis ultiminotia]|uniref:Hydrolase n=1 Tax=Amycolatopsis ultiminotia TaxID=543629 RepID=A0ABP6XUX0_9PSEU
MVTSVVFDVGETLLDDSREWGAWADWLNVRRHTFSAVLGAVTVAGRDNAETFEYFRPGFDLARERELREETGCGQQIDESDLYSDVRSALCALRELGLWLGIAGNQTVRAGGLLRALQLPVDHIATSGEWRSRIRASSRGSRSWPPARLTRLSTRATTVTTTSCPRRRRTCALH